MEMEMGRDAIDRRHTEKSNRYGELLGVSAEMQELFSRLRQLEGTKVTLLVRGESGTGKELIARAVHERSPVHRGPFIAVNCGALDRHLARSELFGHQRGAFTGAVRTQVGAFEAANGGTLFLDEVGELPSDVQPMLLRALELRRIAPVGSSEELPVDVRLITATNRDLVAGVRAGTFREDLYYRLLVVQVAVAPLRKRPEDVAVLAQEFARRLGIQVLPAKVLQCFAEHPWPGNVRELRNAVEAYAALGVVPSAGPLGERGIDQALSELVDATKTYAEQKNEFLQGFTRAYLERLLRRTSGNQSEAARVSGLERSYLGRLIEKLGLRATPDTGDPSDPRTR